MLQKWDLITVFWLDDVPVDASSTYGAGHTEGQEAARSAAPQEAGQTSLPTVARRDLRAESLDPVHGSGCR